MSRSSILGEQTAPTDAATVGCRILVVEDDRDLGGQLVDLLGMEGYQAELAADGQRGLHLALTRPYELIIVDRQLPALEGAELVRRLRRQAVTTRILMLSARSQTTDRVEGLDAGSDDYLAKPFEVEELLARVRALRRRSWDEAELIPLGTACIDVRASTVRFADGHHVLLSPREFQLLHRLAARSGVVHTRPQLRTAVFGGAESESIVDTYVYYLRNKLGPGVVKTVRGLGYRVGAL